MLRVENLQKYYESESGFFDRLLGRQQYVKAVDGVSFEIYEGETLGLVGESGCGKSTVGRTVLQLDEPTGGSVYYRGREITGLPEDELRDLRKEMQVVFQNPQSSLNPRLTINDIIGEALDIHGLAEGTTRDERIKELLERVGLSASHANRYPNEFSGGQLQRIGIARALAVDPDFIVCDEPVSALDVSVQAQILNLLEDLQEDLGLSYLFIAHDLSVVEHISDRIAVMYLGELAELGTPEELFTPPQHPYTEALLSAIPEPDPGWDADRIILEGSVPSPIDPPSGCKFHTRCPRVIPPADFELEQSEWRAVLDLVTRIEAADVDVSTAETLVENGDAPDLPTAIRQEYDVPETLSDPDADRALADAVGAVVADDGDPTETGVGETFASPCTTAEPELRETAAGHAACHLFDPEYADPSPTAAPRQVANGDVEGQRTSGDD
ncbi:ABC transporter ATP-binding protein [Halobaculum sp. MBLA0147]|uniref:ABC transporter ATP-binding protein n=1 Tax=Halobaculum sp. MBLA0147 TaxID=3079934 RepID=UPI003526688B